MPSWFHRGTATRWPMLLGVCCTNRDWQPGSHGIVATKVDKLTRAERVRNSRQLESLFDVPVLLVSAQNGEGLDQLWKTIANLPSRTAA